MLKTANKISLLVESQLPNFILEEYELFGKFIQKYYEHLELQGNPVDIITNLETYRDIDFYEKNLLTQSTTLSGSLGETVTTITVADARSFPENGGYIKIDDEICFYATRTDTQFLEVSRGVSGNTTLGDLYNETSFVTTQASIHVDGSVVQNISNLFLYALVKSFESQYLSDFPEDYLKEDIDKRVLIKNIRSFYRTKGTDNSIKFLFKCLIDNDPEPEISYPRDSTLKSSESNWIQVYALKAKLLSGNAESLVGQQIVQNVDGNYASAIVDNVKFSGTYDGDDLYEVILAENTVNGNFSISSKTSLTEDLTVNNTVGDRVNVFSTMGWKDQGSFVIDEEEFTFEEKNVNQFVIKTRSGSGTYPSGTLVTYGDDVYSGSTKLLVFGVIYALQSVHGAPYSNPGDYVEITEPGFLTSDIRINTLQNNLRWIIDAGTPAIADIVADVSAIFEDGEGYYIASSGYPSHSIPALPSDAKDQKNLKIIRKHPISTTEIYETGHRDVGVAVNGIPFLGYKDKESIQFGPIESVKVHTRGSGYAKEPFVLINGIPNLCRSRLAGQVVESIVIDTPGSYNGTPTIEILSGRNASATAVVTNGEITSIVVDNPGEYYSSPPQVRITDLSGKGRFADYRATVSNEGELTGFLKVNGGNLYSQENIVIDIIPVGSGATASVSIRTWVKDKYYKNKNVLDNENGYFFKNFVESRGSGYGYYAAPNTIRPNDNGINHSNICGFAYDGNPIYGPFGFSDALDSQSGISRMTSSYSKNISRNGPSANTYPLGTFIDDYTYVDGLGSLDRNNGRYCVTPDYPNGTYAYFLTLDTSNDPVFPYILGENYYSLPVSSNYSSEISQKDLPSSAKRLRTNDTPKNGDLAIARIDDVNRGSISSVSVYNSVNTFSVGSEVCVDDSYTEGFGAQAEVSSVKGRVVQNIESQDTKALFIQLKTTAYLFEGDTITQALSGASGEIVGNVFSSTRFALRNVSGNFNLGDTLSSSTKVISLILDQNSSYTKGATLELSDGVALPVATAEVLETTTNQNTVKIKVLSGNFVVDSDLFLRSSDLINTTGSKIVSISLLSDNLSIFEITDNVAILETADAHGVANSDIIDIDINPDDSISTTTYYVRSRIYQEALLKTIGVTRVLSDTGIGRVAILNGGNDYTPNTYIDIALSGGSGTGAKATIVVSSTGSVNGITITDKGSGYSKFDILTVGDTALSKTDASSPKLQLSVDHSGFALQNAVLNVDSSLGFTIGDDLKINDEIVTIISKSQNALTVQRGMYGTSAADHFDGASVSIYESSYNISPGLQLATGATVLSYDRDTQEIVFVYDYNKTLSNINEVTLSTVFFDQSADQRLVEIIRVSDPTLCFEFSLDNTSFTRNPNLELKNNYKYNFDTTHSSMSNVRLDFSPSKNLNLVTPEVNYSTNGVDVKFGYGPRIASNNYTTKVDNPYTKYFYYDKNKNVQSEDAFLELITDPLQGSKTAIYVTSTKVVYNTPISATHDGTGSITYISRSRFSIGEINTIGITNIGRDYKKVPTILGVVPTLSYQARATCSIKDGKIFGIDLSNTGSNYTKPVITVEGNAKLSALYDRGKVTGIEILDPGSNYTEAPTIKIAESDVECYIDSNEIGVPRNITVINNGGSYHNDKTLSSSFRSNYALSLSDFESDSFAVGETIVQMFGNTEVARARVTSWRSNSNILTVDRIKGVLRTGLQIKGLSRKKTATLNSVRFTEYVPEIRSYYDNQGYFQSDSGKISDQNQKISDSYYYQDYSYLVKSKTSIDTWRSLIKSTTHPAGFKVFGEILIESNSNVAIPKAPAYNSVSVLQVWNPSVNKISVVKTSKKITQSIALVKEINVERGVGSVALESFNNSEILSNQVYLTEAFDGDFSDKGNLQGKTIFNLVDASGNKITPYNEQALTITLDGILQEPGRSFELDGDKIIFAEPPLGPSVKDGQDVPGVLFHARWFQFKSDILNQKYLRKIRNIFQRSGTWIDAANQVAQNRRFIQSETLGYIQSKYTSFAWTNLGTKCFRDIGLVVDALEHDLRFGGNEKTIAAAESYFRSGVLDYISGELEATIDAFAYAVRLCKLAMRNWDYIDRQVSWTPGTDIVTISDTNNVAIGMKISSGVGFPEGTYVSEIIDRRTIKTSNPSNTSNNNAFLRITQNTITTEDVDSTASTIQIAENIFLQVGTGFNYTLPLSAVGVQDNSQMAFIWSGINTGTFYDASVLIEANKVNIQREVSHRISNNFPKFNYPRTPVESYRFKDARRLIYNNLSDIVSQTITELETVFGTQYATDKCSRDLTIIVAAIAEDVGRGGNSATIETTNMYFDSHDALDGERTESVYAFEYARELCIEALNNRGTVTDPNVTATADSSGIGCSNVNAAVTVLFDILINSIENNQKPTITKNTGITSWVETEDFCFRDTGLLVDAMVFCLRFGGNKKIIDFANAYYYKGNLNHVKGELTETIYGYREARDLMIKAMLNQISGTTIIAPVKDELVRIDTTTPACAAIESTITTLAQIAEDILEGGPDRIEVLPENPNSSGYWTTLLSSSNQDILPDPGLVNGVLAECEDVASSLDSLYENIRETLTTGPHTAQLSYPDYIDGENTIFDLYYEDGTPVNTELNENLFIALSGVLQHDAAYTIDRTYVPNRVVFSTPPIWGQTENTKKVQEPLAVEKFFAHSIGNYIRCEIDKSGILDGSGGPFLILNSKNNKVQNVDDSRFAFVFIDGVLQREGDSYTINGPAIRFSRKIFRDNNIEIIIAYGRDIEQSVTLFDFQSNTYYNEIILTCNSGNVNLFTDWKTWYNNSFEKFQVAYQKVNGVKRFIGNVKSYTTDPRNLIITLAGSNPNLDSSNIFFAGDSEFSDEYELTGTTNDLVVVRDTDNDYRMQRNSANWLYGTPRADESFYERMRLLANVNKNDLIRIDGEKDFRTIKGLPRYVNPKNYNAGEDTSNDLFGSVTTSNYNGDSDGVGLSVTCEIENGKVTTITWNRKDLQLLYDEGIIQPTTAYGYDRPPILHFVPVNQSGGGATAEVVVSRGQIIDIVLTNPGSGYTKAPRVITARGYDIIKSSGRKIDTFHTLGIGTKVGQASPVNVASFFEFTKSIDNVLGFGVSVEHADTDVNIEIQHIISHAPVFHVRGEYQSFNPNAIVATVPAITTTGADVISILELNRTLVSQPIHSILIEKIKTVEGGFSMWSPDLENLTFFNNFDHWQNSKFMHLGDIKAPSGSPVSEVQLAELEPYQITSDGSSTSAYPFNLGYSSINYYISRIDTSDLPGESDAGYVATNAVVYANTSNFPDYGTILVGKEQISYAFKLGDRFLGCTRGVNESPITKHLIGDHLRNAL